MSLPTPIALLVEDEAPIRHFVRNALEADGWKVVEAPTLKRARIDVAARTPDLVILDLGLPDGEGIAFILELRRDSAVPIIVLSARADESDKIGALDVGADDYLTKPFGVGELLARVRAMLRRQRQPGVDPQGLFKLGDIRIDLRARQVSKDGLPVHLTPTEYRLLAVLVNNAGRVVSNPQLLREVWGPAHAENGHYLRIYMGHLRQKLEDDPARPKLLLTETAVGYRVPLPG